MEPRDARQPVAHPPNPYALDARAPRARLDADTLADLTCSDMLEGMLVLPQLAEPARPLPLRVSLGSRHEKGKAKVLFARALRRTRAC